MTRQDLYKEIEKVTGEKFRSGSMPYSFDGIDLNMIWDFAATEEMRRLNEAIGDSYAEIITGKVYQ